MSKGSEQAYQAESNVIRWKVHFSSPPDKVYEALSTDKGRRGYWAESAEEHDGKIHYVFLNGIENTGAILQRIHGQLFSVMYFGWKTTFHLTTDGATGTDMEMVAENVPESDKMEVSAGWVSWLMAMKASVDFGVDLRNHHSNRTWFNGYVDN
jgi:uncharacterized protein YndB with AHSA1/START domain